MTSEWHNVFMPRASTPSELDALAVWFLIGAGLGAIILLIAALR